MGFFFSNIFVEEYLQSGELEKRDQCENQTSLPKEFQTYEETCESLVRRDRCQTAWIYSFLGSKINHSPRGHSERSVVQPIECWIHSRHAKSHFSNRALALEHTSTIGIFNFRQIFRLSFRGCSTGDVRAAVEAMQNFNFCDLTLCC